LARISGLWAAAFAALALTPAPALAQSAPPDDPGLRGAAPDDAADALPDLNTPPADPPPRARRPKSGQLPPLAPYRRAARARLRGTVDPPSPDAVPAPTVAALPEPEPRRRIKREDKPFDPVGLYVGNLKLTPYVEEDVGYVSNPFGASVAPKGSALSTTEVGVALQSDWSRNELSGQARIGYNDYVQTPKASAPYGSGLVDYRYDVSRDLAFDTEGRFNLATQTNAQLGLSGATSQALTLVSTYGATLGGTQKFGDLSLGLHGTVDRVQYQGGSLSTDDYDDYGLKLRASYRVSEAVSPFAEVGGDVRQYDSRLDASGYDRASDGITGKAGLRLAPSEMLTGEFSVGYGARDYRDARLPSAAAPLFDASLLWSVTPLTTLKFNASSALGDAVVAGASADIARSYTIGVDHALTERVKLGLTAGLSTDHYIGIDQTDRSYTIGATAEYHLSREVVLKASATHQQFVSSAPGSNYADDTVLLGVRLQR
jgi:hypothetical protein